MSFGVSEKQIAATIENMEGGRLVQSLLVSNETTYIKHFNSLFEELWKYGIDAADRIKDIEQGTGLPNMEKRYWLFLDSALMEKTEQGTSDLFVAIYFSYEFPGRRSGYGMISQYDRKSAGFIHRDMWLD